jgi:hypothetical protein
LGADYYKARARDYARRQEAVGSPQAPPDYYLEYGDRYARRFTEVLRPRLSRAGREWIDATFYWLQRLMEQQRQASPRRFAALEDDPDAFKQFAYGTHAPAYIACGVAALPLRDLVLIALTIDIRDVLSRAGVAQALIVLWQVVHERAQAALAGVAGLARQAGTFEPAV